MIWNHIDEIKAADASDAEAIKSELAPAALSFGIGGQVNVYVL